MKDRYVLDGIVPSLNTPFDEHGRVDFPSLTRLVEHHLDEGAVGFLTTAQAAEVFELSVQERIAIIKLVRDMTKGRSKVIAGATSRSHAESLVLAEAAVTAGCDGVLVEVPSFAKADRVQTINFFEAFAERGMDMLMIQDLDWTGCGMDLSLISELFERIPSFRSIKVETNPSGPKYSAILEATTNRLHVCGGWASLQLIEALDRGVSAFLPTALTRPLVRVIRSYRQQDRDAAKRWFYSILPVLAFTRQHLDTSIVFHKMLFHRRGIFSTPGVRKRVNTFDSYHRQYAEELLIYLEAIEADLATE